MANGNNKNLVQIILIIAMAGFIAIKDIGAPIVRSMMGSEQERTSQQVAVNTERITRLEIAVQKLELIPATLAVQATTLSIMASTLDKIEKKLDEHMSKGR
jgi:hypothetical protein